MGQQSGNRNNSKTKPNHIYSILSVAIVLFLLGLLGLTLIQAQKLVRYFNENINLIVEINDGASNIEIQELELFIRQSKYLNESSLEMVSKDSAAEIMQAEFGEDMALLEYNPFYNSYNFGINSTYIHEDSLSAIANGLKAIPIVREVYYPRELSINITQFISKLVITMLMFGFFFILIAIFMINNTVKLALYSNRFVIKNMQLVGAPWSFIRKSYLVKSIYNGLISALLAITALLFILFYAKTKISSLLSIQDTIRFSLLFILLLLLGVGISWISTRWGINKYLKMKLDDLY